MKKIMAKLTRRDDSAKITGRGRGLGNMTKWINQKAIEHPKLCVIVHSKQTWLTAGQENKD